jgi:hypothetical protein
MNRIIPIIETAKTPTIVAKTYLKNSFILMVVFIFHYIYFFAGWAATILKITNIRFHAQGLSGNRRKYRK